MVPISILTRYKKKNINRIKKKNASAKITSLLFTSFLLIAMLHFILIVYNILQHLLQYTRSIGIGRNSCRDCITLREKCPLREFFWSVFSHIRTKYGENTEQKNSEYRHFSGSVSALLVYN